MSVQFSMSNKYVLDFNATGIGNYKQDGYVQVYLWVMSSLLKDNDLSNGKSMDSLIEFITTLPDCRHIYVHNLDYHITFIEEYLLYHGYEFVSTSSLSSINKRAYSVLRTELNDVFGCTIYLPNGHRVQFIDSLKLFPQDITALSKIVGYSEFIIHDFNKKKESYIELEDYKPSSEEIEDISARVLTVKECLRIHFEYYGDNDSEHYIKQNMLTRSSYAFKDLINHTERKYETDFKEIFPSTSVSDRKEMNSAFWGGLVYKKDVSDKYLDDNTPWTDSEGIIRNDGLVLDVNSEFPYVMTDRYFPYGEPKKFEGKYKKDEEYPLFIQSFTSVFNLKENGIPMLSKSLSKGGRPVRSNKDLLRTDTVIYLSNVDFRHFIRNYNIESIDYINGYKFKSIFAPFKEFIESKNEEKIKYQNENKMIQRFLVKTDMVSCYGKFGQKVSRRTKVTKFKNGIQYYELSDAKERKENYFPMAIFISAYGRDVLLNGAYKAGFDRVLYMDTDSLHLWGTDIPKGLDISQSKLGSWKVESTFTKAKYIKEKLYIEVDSNDDMIIKASGITESGKDIINRIEDFKEGMNFGNMYQKTLVQGGCIYKTITKKVLTEDNIKEEKLEIKEIPQKVLDLTKIIDDTYNFNVSIKERINKYNQITLSEQDLEFILNDEYLSNVYRKFEDKKNYLIDGKYPSIGMYEIEEDILGYLRLIYKFKDTDKYKEMLKSKLDNNIVYKDVLEFNTKLKEEISSLIG